MSTTCKPIFALTSVSDHTSSVSRMVCDDAGSTDSNSSNDISEGLGLSLSSLLIQAGFCFGLLLKTVVMMMDIRDNFRILVEVLTTFGVR